MLCEGLEIIQHFFFLFCSTENDGGECLIRWMLECPFCFIDPTINLFFVNEFNEGTRNGILLLNFNLMWRKSYEENKKCL